MATTVKIIGPIDSGSGYTVYCSSCKTEKKFWTRENALEEQAKHVVTHGTD